MKYVIFRSESASKHYARTLFEKHFHVRRPNKNLIDRDVFIDSPEQHQTQEKPPIGIEASMVCIAIPAGLAIWVIFIYLVYFMFF